MGDKKLRVMSETQSLNLVHSFPSKLREEVRKEGLMEVIWSEIPEELVYLFAERLVCVDDLIRFSSVCKLRRIVSISEKQKKKAYTPFMMLANAENDNMPNSDIINDGQCMRSFVIPYKGQNKMRSFNLELPKAQGRRCWGSPYGWVVTIGLDLDIGLLNPLTGAHLPLPPQLLLDQSLFSRSVLMKHTLEDISVFTRKIALGWHPSSQSWLVMAIFGKDEEVCFTFTGIEKEPSPWTCIESTVDAEDVILFQGRIYLIAFGGELKVYDLKEGSPPKAIRIVQSPKHPSTDVLNNSKTFYLVEIGGNLHFVARYFDHGEKEQHHCYVTANFIVWRFNFSKTNWYKLDDLGEYALFLGNNTSFAISTLTYPNVSRNCVYFTDDPYATWDIDMGVYDYKERTVKPFDIAIIGAVSKFSCPTFFMPTL